MSTRQQLEEERRERLWTVEHELLTGGARHIAGVDEAGRGPLAGPLVVAAVILPPDCRLDGLDDSKKMTHGARERLYPQIIEMALSFSIQVVPVEIIDAINILQATYLGMRDALHALSPVPDIALVDGYPLPNCPVPQQNLIHGDARSASIAAASVLAKVMRDHLLTELDVQYPAYGFARHKGYPTPEHRTALFRLGPCPEHRRSFGPVRAAWEQGKLKIESGDSHR